MSEIMPDKRFTEVVNGQQVVRTLAQSGTIIPEPAKDPAKYFTALLQTDDGPQQVVKVLDMGGGGGGGTSDYSQLSNKPQINSVTLTGNQTSADLHLQGATAIETLTTASTELATNTIYNGGELASVTITLPATVPADFIAQVEFTSGTTPTTFTAPATLYFNGDACEAGVFTPVASKRYCFIVISDGVNVIAFVYEK